MNWLHNIRMAYKILCLSIVAAIGMAAIAYTGYHSLAKTESSMKIMFEQKMPAKHHNRWAASARKAQIKQYKSA